ncbi:transcription factor Adf-1-like isoform X2 [Teleopsis dalmanni]|uniref:transcription factor Adf-1-like isoform X2 n=1 Tax=Teleopsis dalmanni TaxID=139649 RepID=UPI0018CE4368|nr:transcription factor Adf-1-like isoform X2 [Teleopsis dalmanni]
MIGANKTSSKTKCQKRSGKLVVLNEEELIRQVAMRPILYDKKMKAYRKSGLRHQHWEEVGNAMGASIIECRRRWRSLRDAFSKHYKFMSKTTSGASKRKKWIFYDQMSFIAPFLDKSSVDDFIDDYGDNSDDNAIMPASTSDMDKEFALQCSDELLNESKEITDLNKRGFTQLPSSASVTEDNDVKTTQSTSLSKLSAMSDEYKPSTNEHRIEENPNTDTDSDEKFLLSCVPIMQRLSSRKNSYARLKIMQILYNIEFEETDFYCYTNSC